MGNGLWPSPIRRFFLTYDHSLKCKSGRGLGMRLGWIEGCRQIESAQLTASIQSWTEMSDSLHSQSMSAHCCYCRLQGNWVGSLKYNSACNTAVWREICHHNGAQCCHGNRLDISYHSVSTSTAVLYKARTHDVCTRTGGEGPGSKGARIFM